MSGKGSFLDRIRSRRSLGYITGLRNAAARADLPRLRDMEAEVRRFRSKAVQAERTVQSRLAAASPARPAPGLPVRTEWSFRPSPWSVRQPELLAIGANDGTQLAEGVTLHHDCPLAEVTARQTTATGEAQAYDVALDVLGFEGSYLSLAIAFPGAALPGLTKDTLFRVDLDFLADRNSEIYTRLNLSHGPNTERIVRGVEAGTKFVDFDLFYADLEPAEVSGVWLDIIMQDPEMNRLLLRDVVLSRRPRANV